jgi:hypothetical protein
MDFYILYGPGANFTVYLYVAAGLSDSWLSRTPFFVEKQWGKNHYYSSRTQDVASTAVTD